MTWLDETQPLPPLQWRLRGCTPRKYNGATPIKYPHLYDAVDVATYRPHGTTVEVLQRMEAEREQAR